MKLQLMAKTLLVTSFFTSATVAAACGCDDPEVKQLPDVPAVIAGDTSTDCDVLVLPERDKPTFEGKMVVGYYPTWNTWWGEPDYSKLSLLCIAFAEMRGDGHLYYDGARNLKNVIDNAHAAGTKVVISLRDAKNVSVALADEKLRKNLAKEVKYCISELNLDGVDVDYEEWGGDNDAKGNNLEEFYKDIRAQIGDGYLLTAAVVGSTNADGKLKENTLRHLDYVFPMVYDSCGGWRGGGGWGQVGQHSSYEYFRDVIEYFTNGLNVPKEKLCPGLPFYGYEFKSATSTDDAASVAYRELFDRFPDEDVANTDNIGLIWYNCIPTITQKCQYALDEDVAGVMIWELSQDTRDEETSLLNAVHKTLNK